MALLLIDSKHTQKKKNIKQQRQKTSNYNCHYYFFFFLSLKFNSLAGKQKNSNLIPEFDLKVLLNILFSKTCFY